nr:ameletin - rat [Rattus norvegicus]
QAGYSK